VVLLKITMQMITSKVFMIGSNERTDIPYKQESFP